MVTGPFPCHWFLRRVLLQIKKGSVKVVRSTVFYTENHEMLCALQLSDSSWKGIVLHLPPWESADRGMNNTHNGVEEKEMKDMELLSTGYFAKCWYS